tara:strand:- start:1769 stop:1966 length:198 start_codon:yes stop_codon:yes gene_type:complete
MESAVQFLDMGGYALFVWPAFIMVAIVMTALLIWSWRDLRRERQTLELLAERRGSGETAGTGNDA